MAESTKRDTFGSVGGEPVTLKELMDALAAAIEKVAKSDGQATLARLEETVRQRPLLSIAVAAAVGFVLGSLGRR